MFFYSTYLLLLVAFSQSVFLPRGERAHRVGVAVAKGRVWVVAASSPRESLSISAPNCPKADMVHGESVSCNHSSCVSMVVSSVSVEAAEHPPTPPLPPPPPPPPLWWWCWGVVGPLGARVTLNNLRHVHLRSVNKKSKQFRNVIFSHVGY